MGDVDCVLYDNMQAPTRQFRPHGLVLDGFGHTVPYENSGGSHQAGLCTCKDAARLKLTMSPTSKL